MYPVNTTKSYFFKFPESYLATFFCWLSWKENDDCLLNCKCGVSSKILCISVTLMGKMATGSWRKIGEPRS